MRQLRTRWYEAAERGETLQEYPRPQMRRDSYIPLNGRWEYEILRGGETVSAGEIRVPFAPESALSGVEHILQPEEELVYHRRFERPDMADSDRLLLHLGAVDQVCRLWINGQEIGSHAGGYTAFTFDITDVLRDGGNELTLRVVDATEMAPYGRGKQRLQRKGDLENLFYTPVSGIWKSVWMECVPERYIERLEITPLFDEGAVRIRLVMAEAVTGTIEIALGGTVVAAGTLAAGQQEIVIPIPDPQAWTPDSPTLYDVEIRCGEDHVTSYLGMRKVEIRKDPGGILRFYLNNEPVFMNGVLDQGYWPDGLLTAPSDVAYVHDIERLKAMGYNLIRKHIKVEPERFYYHCDRLGMLVWQDIPNGGGQYNMYFLAYLPNVLTWSWNHIRDRHYRWFAREDAAGREIYYQELTEIMTELYNHPSIVAWVPFNEGWGQFDALAVADRVRVLDPTRLINHACGWFDQGGGDMYTIHNYWRRLHVHPQTDRVVALTEYGGYALPVPGHLYAEENFGYKDYHSGEELTAGYVSLIERDILPNIANGLSAAIYTQLSDIETEINGLMTYDREVDKFDLPRIREVNARINQEFRERTCLQFEQRT